MKVYFDKNVLSHVIGAQRGDTETNGVTRDDVKVLFESVAAGKITCSLSFMHLQEAAYVLRSGSQDKADAELRLIENVMSTTEIIKPSDQLLVDDVMAFARRESGASQLMPFNYRLSDLFRLDGDIDERKRALDGTDEHNDHFRNLFEAATEHDREIVLEEFGNKPPSFEEFFQAKLFDRMLTTIQKIERRTSSTGLVDACKARGIEELVNVRSLYLAEGVSLSYSHARMFGGISKKKKKRHGDPPDLQHALATSTCEVLVTHDDDFAFWMNRIPHKNIEVLNHLRELGELIR